MLKAYHRGPSGLICLTDPAEVGDGALWIDLFDPVPSEREAVRRLLGLDPPTKAEMAEIEASSRLYVEDGAMVMTAGVLVYAESERPVVTPVTFILKGECLVTLRHHDPLPFRTFVPRLDRSGSTIGLAVLLGLLEAVVDRSADILERSMSDLDELTEQVFSNKAVNPLKKFDLNAVLKRIGQVGDRVSKLRESLSGLSRLMLFLAQAMEETKPSKDIRARLKTLQRDVKSLTDQDSFVTARISFLLDATLGLISIEQNAIIKIFSVAATAFLPPTLIASIYGMNFHHMPELDWKLGYPIAVMLMVLSAILPLWYFRRRGWL